jgi:hypothetical protein
MLFTGTGLTDEARQLAARLNIRVIDGDELDRLIRAHAPELLTPEQRPPDDLAAAESHARAAAP